MNSRWTPYVLCAMTLFASPPALSAGEPEPGLWQFSADLSIPSAPGFNQQPVSINQCLRASDVQDPSRVLTGIATPGASGCTFSNKRESAGHTDFSVQCEGLFALSGTGSVNYSPSSMDGQLNVSFGGGGGATLPRVESVSRIKATRLGGC